MPRLSALWLPRHVLLREAPESLLRPLAHSQAPPGFRAHFPCRSPSSREPDLAEPEVGWLLLLHLCGLLSLVQGPHGCAVGMAVGRLLSSADSQSLLGLPSASPGRKALLPVTCVSPRGCNQSWPLTCLVLPQCPAPGTPEPGPEPQGLWRLLGDASLPWV